MTDPSFTLAELGWRAAFQSQMTLDEFEATAPARVAAVHRGALDLLSERGAAHVASDQLFSNDPNDQPAVGDWLLLDRASGAPLRLLERSSLIKRGAAGLESKIQPIAANVDALLIATSMNADFNEARLERYLALAYDAETEPVIVLTKADQASAEARRDFEDRARALAPGLAVAAIDARAPDAARALADWTGRGQTAALAGSSGVGKSTLVNSLTEDAAGQAVAGVREDDAKGRHTTTARSMHRMRQGGWIIDTPGMRELRLAEAEEGVDALFADIVDLARHCRFRDCRHEDEPGCAVRAAIARGDLDASRLARAQKLWRENAISSESVRQRRARSKAFGKMVKSAMKLSRRRTRIAPD